MKLRKVYGVLKTEAKTQKISAKIDDTLMARNVQLKECFKTKNSLKR